MYSAGFYKDQYQYKSFMPSLINQEYEVKDSRVWRLLEEATIEMSQLNSYSEFITDIDLYIQLIGTKEATLSSRIEGTRTEVDETVLPEEEISQERRADWEEVSNYIKAMNQSIENLKSLPLCMRLLKEAHQILLSGVQVKGL